MRILSLLSVFSLLVATDADFKTSPVCVAGTTCVGFGVTFTGILAAQEAFHSNHKNDATSDGTTSAAPSEPRLGSSGTVLCPENMIGTNTFRHELNGQGTLRVFSTTANKYDGKDCSAPEFEGIESDICRGSQGDAYADADSATKPGIRRPVKFDNQHCTTAFDNLDTRQQCLYSQKMGHACTPIPDGRKKQIDDAYEKSLHTDSKWDNVKCESACEPKIKSLRDREECINDQNSGTLFGSNKCVVLPKAKAPGCVNEIQRVEYSTGHILSSCAKKSFYTGCTGDTNGKVYDSSFGGGMCTPKDYPPSNPPFKGLFKDHFFVMAHDAATGYMDDVLKNGPVKTQWGTFPEQLTCGARALDLRLGYDLDGEVGPDDEPKLRFHHGPVWIQDGRLNHIGTPTVANTMESVINWAIQNPTELVVLVLSHCQHGKANLLSSNPDLEGENSQGEKFKGCNNYADELISKPFQDLGIFVIDKPWALQTLTMQKAIDLATMDCGGRVLAVYGDSAFSPGRGFNYIDDTFTDAQVIKAYEWPSMFSYWNKQLHSEHTAPWQLQAIWQGSTDITIVAQNIVAQTLRSNINNVLHELARGGYFDKKKSFKDPDFDAAALGLKETESLSKLTDLTSSLSNFQENQRQNVNFLLMNMVADKGYDVAEAMGAKNPAGARGKCRKIVTDYCDKFLSGC